MKPSLNTIKILYLILPIIIATVASATQLSYGDSILAGDTGITVLTDSSQYVLRQVAHVNGTVTLDGSPASDILVAMEIRDPPDPIENPLAYRTLPIGTPNETWVLEIVEMNIYNSSDWAPLDTVKICASYFFGVTVRNPLGVTRDPVVIVLTMCDGNLIPIYAFKAFEGSIGPNSNVTTHRTVYIPPWAYSGEALIYCSVYDKLPSEGGVAYTPEARAEFHISRTERGLFGQLPLQMETHNSSGTIGTYESVFRFSPEPEPDTYTVYVTARYSIISRATNTTTFEVLDWGAPPQASFVYTPLEPYPNQTVSFDASSSSAEGYGDVIIKYEWNFGDGSEPVVKSGNATNPPDPTATHKFMATDQYIVTLNVTDTEGYWSTTQKPINIKSTYPTANFTWIPETPVLNVTVTFDATSSLPGWSIPQAASAPIANYTWNFGDSAFNFTVTEPTIYHMYSEPGNLTVMLTVTDSENQQDVISYIVEVENATALPWDINGDGKTDIKDIAIVAKAYGSFPGDDNWDPRADITGPTPLVPDGKVDIRDIALVASHYGE